jgi:hypothetical protein
MRITRLIHYSKLAARHRDEALRGREQEFYSFATSVQLDALLQVAEEVMIEAGFTAEMIAQTLARLGQGKLTDSRKKLMFAYYVEFRRWK